jgi:hypothetical protein
MRTLLHWAARLYPAEWRARYGQELQGLLDDLEPAWQDVLDVVNGGLQMQLRHSVVRLAFVFGIVGVCVAGVVALSLPKQFVSRGVVSCWPPNKPVFVKPGQPPATVVTAISAADLKSVLDADNLFPSSIGSEREKRLRDSVRIDQVTRNSVRVSFAYPDAHTAQQVTRDLMIMIANNTRARTYLSTVVYEEPNVPRTAEQTHRVVLIAIGLLGGVILGMVMGTVWQRARPSV